MLLAVFVKFLDSYFFAILHISVNFLQDTVKESMLTDIGTLIVKVRFLHTIKSLLMPKIFHLNNILLVIFSYFNSRLSDRSAMLARDFAPDLDAPLSGVKRKRTTDTLREPKRIVSIEDL